MKQRFGLIGDPIKLSLSPSLFRAAYNGAYGYDLIEGSDFDASYMRFLKEYKAINVTAPFKEKAFLKADSATQECRAIGAANILLKNGDGSITAANSDSMGVSGALETVLQNKTDRPDEALVVGCGGAAKAAIYAALTSGFSVTVINCNLEKAEVYAERMSRLGFEGRIAAKSIDTFCECFRRSGVIIYTLPLAIPGIQELTGQDIRGGSYGTQAKYILEANYKNPAFSGGILATMQKGNPELTYISGREWLLHQAIGAYRIFTGDEPDIEAMRKVL